MKVVLAVVGGLAAVVLVSGAWIYATTNFDAASGPGWRLVGATRSGPWSFFNEGEHHAELVTDQAGVDQLWAVLGLGAPIPEPDFTHEAIMRVTGFGSGSCPLHFDDLDIGLDGIAARMSAGFTLSCSGDAQPYTFVLVVERDCLPAAPFSIQVDSDAGSRETVIDAVESPPG